MTTRGAGGTPGGLGMFFTGLAMMIGGGYLFMSRVTVTSGFWSFAGRNTFGLSLLPLLVGVGILFFSGKSPLGWLLTTAGALIVLLGVIANLNVFFGPATLFDTLLMLGLLAAGLGLVLRSLRDASVAAEELKEPVRKL